MLPFEERRAYVSAVGRLLLRDALKIDNFNNPKTQKRLFTEKEVSVITEIPVMTLRSHRHLRRGLPFIRIGNLVRYDLVEVEQILIDQTIKPQTH